MKRNGCFYVLLLAGLGLVGTWTTGCGRSDGGKLVTHEFELGSHHVEFRNCGDITYSSEKLLPSGEQGYLFRFDDLFFCLAGEKLVVDRKAYKIARADAIAIDRGGVTINGMSSEGRALVDGEILDLYPPSHRQMQVAGFSLQIRSRLYNGIVEGPGLPSAICIGTNRVSIQESKLMINGRETLVLSDGDTIRIDEGTLRVTGHLPIELVPEDGVIKALESAHDPFSESP